MTKALLLASAAVAAVALPVHAADLIAPAKIFDWSGFYAGIHAGIINGNVAINEQRTTNAIGPVKLDAIGGDGGGSLTGLIAGGLFGYTFPTSVLFPRDTFSLEADIGGAQAGGFGQNGGEDCGVDYFYDLNWDAHVRALLGFPMGGSVTPFIAGGLAIADLNIGEGCSLNEGGIYTGGSIGAGANFTASQNMFIRAEVLYDFYGKKHYDDFSADFNAWTVRAALVFKLH